MSTASESATERDTAAAAADDDVVAHDEKVDDASTRDILHSLNETKAKVCFWLVYAEECWIRHLRLFRL